MEREDGPFAGTRDGCHLPREPIEALNARTTDFGAVAERFVGTPYLWGGKSAFGLDCSGLVQLLLHIAGISLLRDSDMQQSPLGRPLDPAE